MEKKKTSAAYAFAEKRNSFIMKKILTPKHTFYEEETRGCGVRTGLKNRKDINQYNYTPTKTFILEKQAAAAYALT